MRAYEILLEQHKSGTFVSMRPSPAAITALAEWQKENNIPNPYDPSHMHVTLLLSKDKEFPWEPKSYKLKIDPSTYKLEKFGPDHDVLVLSFKSEELEKRHMVGRKKHNLTWDFDDYKPHITLAKDLPEDFNIEELVVPSFSIILDGEYTEKYKSDLSETAGVGTIQKHNTTADVQPGEIQRQAKKWGWEIDDEGNPPLIDTIHKRKKNKNYNEWLTFRNRILEASDSVTDNDLQRMFEFRKKNWTKLGEKFEDEDLEDFLQIYKDHFPKNLDDNNHYYAVSVFSSAGVKKSEIIVSEFTHTRTKLDLLVAPYDKRDQTEIHLGFDTELERRNFIIHLKMVFQPDYKVTVT